MDDSRYDGVEKLEVLRTILGEFHDYCVNKTDKTPTIEKELEDEILVAISIVGFEMLSNLDDLITLRKRDASL